MRELLGVVQPRWSPSSHSSPANAAAGAARAVVAQVREEHRLPAPDEFANFLSEVAAVVTSSVEQWRARLASTVARWAGEGYATQSLERFLDGVEPPDVDAVEPGFPRRCNQLRDLEQEAARLDPRLAGVAVFRDPAPPRGSDGRSLCARWRRTTRHRRRPRT